MVEPISITIGLVSAVAACISAFRDGGILFSKWRRKKAKRQQSDQQCEQLDKALTQAPSDVQREFDHLSGILGPHFARGDRDSIHAVITSLTKFNRTLIQALRTALGQNLMVNLGQLLTTTRGLHDDIISSMTSLVHRVKLSQPISQPPCYQNESNGDGRSCYVLAPVRSLPAFSEYAAAPIPEYTPLNTISALRRNLDAISSISSDAQNTAEGLGQTLDALIVQSDRSIRQVALENLPSESLVQAQIRALS